VIKSLKIILIVAVLIITANADILAQVVAGRPASIGTRIVYYHWSLDDKKNGSTSFSQFYFPIKGFVPVRENLELLFFAAGSVNDLKTDHQATGLTGASDIRFQINQSLSEDRIIISLGLNLPTGKTDLTFDTDTTVLGILSRNYLSFPMRRFGQGLGGNILIGGATMLGSLRGGLGLLFEFTGKYEPYRGLGKYNPGNFFSVTAGLDRKLEKSILFGDITLTLYTPDRYQDSKTFKQSSQAFFRVGSRYQTGRYQGEFRLGYLWRGRNTQYDANESVTDQFQLFGNEFTAQLNLSRYFGDGWAISPAWEIKIISANEGEGPNELRGSHYVGLGGSLTKAIKNGPVLSAGSKYFAGSANSGSITINGVNIFTSATVTF